jgi:hypothetical protein
MNNMNSFNNNNQQKPPVNQYTQSRPLNTQIDNPEVEFIQKEQRNSMIWHLVSVLLVFIASVVVHKYAILVTVGAVGIWIATAIAVHLSPDEECPNIKKNKIWITGYTLLAIIFDMVTYNLSFNPQGYGLDSAAIQFINVMRIMIFLGTPIMYIGITLKRIHFNWEVRNNEKRTASVMRQNTKKLF